ncbi:SNF2 family N-terminal domain-containing protein [Lophiotrema nucula]|uniref:SNF2 family N-terminal domain-containing protein n=1 Tax=Lophiotrema nucula TaxID=690887 RepID=A0A6A5ZCR6_9PLEO|nr:SNF2 family N-terminal domain-containing protein [Lophiotrema nucula]
MSTSPKKHRGTFRPVNTLSSPQKPQYSTTHSSPKAPSVHSSQAPLHISLLDDSDESHSDRENNLRSVADRFEHLGNSSSLFDDNDSKENSAVMVREREPPSIPGQPQARKEASVPKPLQDLTNAPPEFGKASPIRNPLQKDQSKGYSNVFNVPKPGQKRPEHHRDGPPRPPPSFPPATTAPSNQQDLFSNVGRQPAHPFHTGPRFSTASSAGSDIVEIPASHFQPRPSNPMRTIQPAPRPMYSTMGHANGFQPVNQEFSGINPWKPSRQTVLLPDPVSKRASADDEDDFDPDAAIRAESHQFGAPDPFAYVDQSKANENIKALLEGAFDEDEVRIPRTRGRKKTQQVEAAKSLAAKLQALEVTQDAESKGEPEEEEEEDDGTVDGLKVKLLPHQVDGVAWMIEKETGAHNKRGKLPKGGILADDMGLGKTIQSIAVMLSNPRPDKDAEPENKKNKIAPTVGKGTLIVAPLALIKQWESEINTKVSSSHSLKVLVHHGTNRTKSPDKLKTYDVVITTYQVLASEHASCGEGPDGLKKGCFAVHWYRVILDEAHTIKNRNAKMTKACYDVRSHYRWCLTGTPMQNNLDELQSLIKFLRIQPYSEMSNWKESITGPMKNGRGNLAMRRLQIFLKAFMKRRTKDVLKKEGALNFGGKTKTGEDKPAFQIVARNIETVIGEFTVKERAFYERLSDRAESRLAEMMGAEKTDYIGALVLLLRLRQACNHPNLTKSNVKDDKDALTTEKKVGAASDAQTPRKGGQDADADDLADLLGGLSVATKRCDICQHTLTRDNAAAGAIRCNECEDDLNASQKKMKKKSKKHKKDRKQRDGKKQHYKMKEPADVKTSRQRRVVVDSDDEDEGEWIVSDSEQKNVDLGKAGGTDDEDAEGGGDTLGSVDSDSFASDDDGTPSKKKQNDSFIVHDTDSEEEGPVIRKQQAKKKKVISLVSEDESESNADSESEESDSEAKSDDSDTDDSEIEYNASDLTPSTKIRQLLAILEKETPDHKVIVFSQFTSMLDLIEPFLRREGYNFTRYDGKMRNDLREASLHKLRNDKRTRVLLCSLKCGSLGLNLTAASRVVIMEPFWNPFVEEQAIDRVHRLNQTVDVTVYRLSIHNSVEERILELQEAKRKLAAAAIDGGKAVGKLSMKDILALFRHDAEFDHHNADDGADHTVFSRTRVLESPVKAGVTGHVEKGINTMIERAEPVVRRNAGSLGLKALKKVEDSVWGRR